MKKHTSCRICASTDLTLILDLGTMPLANALLEHPDQPEAKYPLQAFACDRCGLVQLGVVVEPEILYANYPFFTGTSESMRAHFSDLMNAATADLKPHSLVVDIGCNDCTAIQTIRRNDLRCVGVDPAGTMPAHGAHVARQIKACFTEELAKFIVAERGKASLITACNVLAHVDDLHDFMRGVTVLLEDDGTFLIEVPYLKHIAYRGEWEQFYHEHLSYFAIRPLVKLLGMHGMKIDNFSFFPDIHGGAVRCRARRGEPYDSGDSCSFDELANAPEQTRTSLRELLACHQRHNHELIAYCASAKGAVVLNYCGIGTDLVPLVIDNTPVKIGKYMPGTKQRIVAPESVDLREYDAVLLLASNHAAEVQAKHPEFDGEWIMPNYLEPARAISA